jgi:uncharacterized membrane protein
LSILLLLFITMGWTVMFSAVRETGYWSNTVQIVFTVLAVIMAIVVLASAFIRKPSLFKITADERTDSINNKSARNALYVTYLVFLIHLMVTDTNNMDASWTFYILGSSCVVLIVSQLFYYYRKS